MYSLKYMYVKKNNKIKFLIDNRLVTDSLDIANCFNNIFVSIGPKLAKDLTHDIDPLSDVDYNVNSIITLEISRTK